MWSPRAEVSDKGRGSTAPRSPATVQTGRWPESWTALICRGGGLRRRLDRRRRNLDVVDGDLELPRLHVHDMVSARRELALDHRRHDMDSLEHDERRVDDQLQMVADELLEELLRR